MSVFPHALATLGCGKNMQALAFVCFLSPGFSRLQEGSVCRPLCRKLTKGGDRLLSLNSRASLEAPSSTDSTFPQKGKGGR